tara:strand:+ start:566 stop:898 length:333 start_codon:yes stop_codon:yes gene_type:complete
MEVIVVYSLCVLFAVLIIYEMINLLNKPIVEGASNGDYQDYSGNDPLILAKQNAGNIKFLKQKFDTIDELSSKVNTLSGSVDSNTESISQILKAQKEQTDKLSGVDSDST